MKSISVIVLIFFAFLSSSLATSEESYKTAREYVSECNASKTIPSIGHFGWKEVEQYWKQVPELQALRDDFEKADKVLLEELMKDDEYRVAYNELIDSSGAERKIKQKEYNKAKSNAYSRLMKNKDFREIQETRGHALFESNIQTLEYIINDYENQGKTFPTDWITKTK